MTERTYKERTLISVGKQCEARGIPPEEVESVLAHIKAKNGTAVDEMDDRQLRDLNRVLPHVLVDYLEGAKRRPVVRKRKRPAAGAGTEAAGSVEIITAADVGTVEEAGLLD